LILPQERPGAAARSRDAARRLGGGGDHAGRLRWAIFRTHTVQVETNELAKVMDDILDRTTRWDDRASTEFCCCWKKRVSPATSIDWRKRGSTSSSRPNGSAVSMLPRRNLMPLVVDGSRHGVPAGLRRLARATDRDRDRTRAGH